MVVTVPVHRLTLKVLRKMYGSHQIHLDISSPLIPLMTTGASLRRGDLTDEIHVTGPLDIIRSLHPDAGYNLFRAHMHQMIDWITLHVTLDHVAWAAMMDYYTAIGLDVDDLDPASVYKQWKRVQNRKKSKNNSYNLPFDVPRNMSHQKGSIKSAIETAAYLIAADPDQFYTRAGRPDPSMIKKAIMYSMSEHHGWSQMDIAGAFGLCQSAVSRHLTPFIPSRALSPCSLPLAPCPQS